MNNATLKLKNGITFRYVIALSLIALLATVAFFALNTALKSTRSTGYIVNISGKQRMLSQHIVVDVYRVFDEIAANERESKYSAKFLKAALSAHAKEMIVSNQILSSGKLPDQTTIPLSAIIRETYFGETNLAARVQEYAETALSLLDKTNRAEIEEIKQSVDERSEGLLRDLNKAVSQYQLEGEEKLRNMKQLETIVWVLTIFTLLLEVIFIFQPMVRQILFLTLSNDKVLESLESTVELRTLHLERANDKLEYLASHDPLTGLKNRLELEKDIEKSIKRYQLHSAPYAILMFDVDWFKKVNDVYGHDVGDMVLVELAAIIKSSIREEDKAFRAGGEEFVVLLNRISYEDSVNLAGKIGKLIESQTFKSGEKEFSKTISCGLYHSSIFEVSSVKDVLQLVDSALYESKTNGRNRLTVVNGKINKQIAKKVVEKIKFVFSDRTLSSILRVENGGVCVSVDEQALSLNRQKFLSIVRMEDLPLLREFPSLISADKPFETTLRIVDVNGKTHICRANVYENENENIVVTLAEANHLAEKISDAILIRNLRSMLDNTNDYIYFKDLNHTFTAASKTLVSITSVEKREDLVGKTDYDVFPQEMADEYFKLEREVFDHGAVVAQELQPTLDNDGNRAWVDNRKYPSYDESGVIIGLFGIARVVSDDERNELLKTNK